jgi:tetratricopeptide (TPR) repeat protein
MTVVSIADDREHPRVAGSVAAMLVLAACSPRGPTPAPLPDDPAAAAVSVRRLATSCPGLRVALDAVTRARFSGRALAGLVDEAIDAARPACEDSAAAIRGASPAHHLARARLATDPGAALAQLPPMLEPALSLRRAELLDQLGRTDEALASLTQALALVADEETLAQYRLLALGSLARRGDLAAIDIALAAAPLPERIPLAHRAVADAPLEQIARLRANSPELTVAAADRVEQEHGPAAARALREQAIALEPDVADHWDALGRARVAAGAITEAMAAWDRASELAPAQTSYAVTPIRALVIAGEHDRARLRAARLARSARTRAEVELHVAASSGAAAVGDAALALALAREALQLRPGDGQLAFLVAERLADTGDRAGAARAYAALLVCGAHGRPWHRHEVAGRLLALGDRVNVQRALAEKPACAPIDPDDLAHYVSRLAAP